uniref:Uncharacterized protein n=1 Tax=viral metagenome TaxID=1070528 RepID=A0A6M3IUZ7_9ZZZZ
MKERPRGFIGEDKIDHDGEIFDYIKELHNYLWEFIYIFHPGAGGSLSDWVNDTLDDIKSGRKVAIKQGSKLYRVKE